MVRGWEGFLKDAMHKVDGPQPAEGMGENEIVLHQKDQYDTYACGFHLMAQKAWHDIKNYESNVGLLTGVSGSKLHRRIPNFS